MYRCLRLVTSERGFLRINSAAESPLDIFLQINNYYPRLSCLCNIKSLFYRFCQIFSFPYRNCIFTDTSCNAFTNNSAPVISIVIPPLCMRVLACIQFIFFGTAIRQYRFLPFQTFYKHLYAVFYILTFFHFR